MKKLIFLSILITALFLGYTSNAGNKPKQPTAYIHYQVNIQNNLPAGQTMCPSSVLITDEHGYLIGELQSYRPYLITYHFYELGPVTGTRVAHLMIDPVSDILCPFTPQPVAQTGSFNNGGTYIFSMFYGPRIPSPIPLPPAER